MDTFGFYIVDGKITDEDEAVCHLSEAAEAPETSGATSTVAPRLSMSSGASPGAHNSSHEPFGIILNEFKLITCLNSFPLDVVTMPQVCDWRVNEAKAASAQGVNIALRPVCAGRSSSLNWTKTRRTSRTRPVWCRSTRSYWRRTRVCPHTTRSAKNSWS